MDGDQWEVGGAVHPAGLDDGPPPVETLDADLDRPLRVFPSSVPSSLPTVLQTTDGRSCLRGIRAVLRTRNHSRVVGVLAPDLLSSALCPCAGCHGG